MESVALETSFRPLIAVSNKLARQIFAVIKYGRKYDPNFGIFCQNEVVI